MVQNENEKKFGKALQSAMRKAPRVEYQAGKRFLQQPVLASEIRQKIFQFLCRHPCCRLSTISRKFEIKGSTVKWHLDKLLQADYIESVKFAKNVVYYPKGLVMAENTFHKVLYLLSKDETKKIYKTVSAAAAPEGGTSLQELLHIFKSKYKLLRLLTDLQNAGLVSKLKDGRNTRYYPTDLLIKYQSLHFEKKIAKKFQTKLISTLVEEGFGVKIELESSNAFQLNIKLPYKNFLLHISTNPFKTALE